MTRFALVRPRLKPRLRLFGRRLHARSLALAFAFLAFSLVLLSPGSARAQAEGGQRERVGQIVAVIGDSIITNWDLVTRLRQWSAATSQPIPDTTTTQFRDLRCTIVDQMVEEMLLLQAALRDTTLAVDEIGLASQIDEHIANLRRSVGGLTAFRQVLAQQGITEAELRDMNMAQQRRTTLREMYVAKVRRDRNPPTVSETEAREYFEQFQDSAGMRPATISLEQVFVPVEPSDSSIQAARVFADSLYNLVAGGAPFDSLAREHSDDPSASLGGSLDWIRRGQMVKEFEDAVFSPFVGTGTVTTPVRTDFGIHLIKVDRIRGAERLVRHILIKPETTQADVERARERAVAIKARLEAGERATDLARTAGTDDEFVARVGPMRRDSLPGPYNLLSNADQTRLRQAGQNSVLEPMLLQLNQGAVQRFLIAKVTETEDARPATYDDYRENIKQQLANQKLAEEIIGELRRRTRVELRFDTGGGC